MAKTLDELRAEYAEAAPVYVRAAGDSYELVDTASGETLGTFETPRQALWNALERSDVSAIVKRANLRTDGEPDGEWRWLDASATEDEAIGGSRITEPALWEMAAGLNERKSAIPINGGGAPDGFVQSESHGDAYKGGDHPANGWAHVGLIVYEADRAHLYLFAELLPEIAREVDRGRLAYGSIFFAFEEADEDDDYGVSGAQLISHALTNDPAVTTLTAGSERRRNNGGSTQRLAFRSMEAMMAKPVDALDALARTARDKTKTPRERMRAALEHMQKSGVRGPIRDLLVKVSEMLGVSEADLAMNPWALEDCVYGLQIASKFEAKIEASTPPTAAAAPADVMAERSTLRMQIDGMTPEESDANHAGFIEWGRKVLGKSDAPAGDVLAELQAVTAQVGAALGTDTPPDEESPATPKAGADATQRAWTPAEGDRVRVREGKEHGDASGEGTVSMVSDEPALEIRFDDMDEPHRWYVASELEQLDDAKAKPKKPEDEEKPGDKPKKPEDDEEDFDKKKERARATAEDHAVVKRERDELRTKCDRYETREWLDEEIGKRKVVVAKSSGKNAEKSEYAKLLDVAITKGRDVALLILDAKARPPSAHPFDGAAGNTPSAPLTLAEAIKECWAEAEAAERKKDPGVPRHHIHSSAQRLAFARWPELKTNSGATPGADSAA